MTRIARLSVLALAALLPLSALAKDPPPKKQPAKPLTIAKLIKMLAVDQTALKAQKELIARGKESVPLLIKAVSNKKHEFLPRRAADTLGKIGPTAISAAKSLVTKALKDEKLSFCLEAVAKMGPGAVKELARGLRSKNRTTKLRCIDLCQRFGDKAGPAVKGLESILRKISDKEPNSRAAAARALGAIGKPAWSAVPSLAKALKDKSSNVVRAARQTLIKFNSDPEAPRSIKEQIETALAPAK